MIRLAAVFVVVLAVVVGGYRFAESSSASANNRPANVAPLSHSHPVAPGSYWMGAHPAGCSVSGVSVASPGKMGALYGLPKIHQVSYSHCDHAQGIQAIFIASVKEPPAASPAREGRPEIYRVRIARRTFTIIYLRRGSTTIQVQLIGQISKTNALALLVSNQPRLA